MYSHMFSNFEIMKEDDIITHTLPDHIPLPIPLSIYTVILTLSKFMAFIFSSITKTNMFLK